MNSAMQQMMAVNSQQQLLAMLNSKNVDPINCSVFVSNIAFDITWPKVKDTFKRAGNCLRVDINEGEDGKSRGYASVVFETPLEALCAVATFNGFELGGRSLQVRLDRNAKITEILSSMGIQSNSVTQAQLIQLQSMATLAMLSSSGLGGLGGGLGGALGGLGGLTGGQSQAAAGYGGMGGGGLNSFMGNGSSSMGGNSFSSSGLRSSNIGSSNYDQPRLGGSSLGSHDLGSRLSSSGG